MKITGTKKLLIIFFALLCTLAAGLGFIITRSATSGVAFAETEVSTDSGAASETKASTDSGAEEEGAIVEDDYDPRFDESVIREIANLSGFDYNVVRLYCHVNGIDAQQLLADLLDERERSNAAQNGGFMDYDKERDGELTDEQIAAMNGSNTPKGELADSLMNDIMLFSEAYGNGEVELSDDDAEKDWFISPDEVSSYAWNLTYNHDWFFINYRDNYNYGVFNFYKENMDPATAATNPWIDVTADVIHDSNLVIPGYNGNYSQLSSVYGTFEYQYDNVSLATRNVNALTGTLLTSGSHNFDIGSAYQCGYKKTITLEAGQRFKFTWVNTPTSGSGGNRRLSNYAWYGASRGGGQHWAKILAYTNTQLDVTSELIIDGDAPTGSIFWASKGSNPWFGDGMSWRRVTWRNAFGNTGNQGASYSWNVATGYGCQYINATTGQATYGSNSNSNYNNLVAFMSQSSLNWAYWIEVDRKDPAKPQIVQDDTSAGTTYTADSKTAFFEGSPVTIALNPDFGGSLLVWSAATNSSFSSPDSTVSLKSRSDHGKEPVYNSNPALSFKAADIVLQSSAAGTHYIKLESPTGRWADGSRDPAIFKLIIKTKETPRPRMKVENGVAPNGNEKTLNYTGEYLTVTFENCDKNLVSCVAPGLEFDWEADGTTLVLKQTERGKYTINLAITNPAGCVWSDTKTTEPLQFTFNIKEMLIDKPQVTAWPTGSGTSHMTNSCEVDYDGTTKTLEISPAYKDQLIIIAAGVKYNFVDKVSDPDNVAETCVFEMKDSGTQTIIIMPNEGFIWKDKTNTQINLTIKIKAVAIDFPTLKLDPDVSGKKKTVTFDPTPGWYAEMVIENCPKDAITYVTAMDGISWEAPADIGKAPEDIIDFDRSVLTLRATSANKYVISFGLTTTNYRWKDSSSSPPVYELEIKKFQLEKAKITDKKTETLDGLTKTIYFNTDPTIQQPYTPVEERYFDLFTGGLVGGRSASWLTTDAGQVTIRYSKDGLTEQWTDIGDSLATSVANLRLLAEKAGNYLIYITPTDNYEWKDGSNDMLTFKFVVTPVAHDTLELFVQVQNGTSWSPCDKNGDAVYNGERHNIRIGNEYIATELFVESEMEFALVDNTDRETKRNDPDGFYLQPKKLRTENGRDIVVLEGYATNADVYTIRLRLKDENYAWRDGSGVDVFYTFTINAQSIGTPKIIGEECSGGQNLQAYETLNMVTAGYNGADVIMVISVKNATSIIEVILDPDGNDIDATKPGGHGIWQDSWGSAGYEDGIDRLILRTVNVGIHKVRLKIKDKNYCWDSDTNYYEFRMVIDYAEVDDIVFSYLTEGEEPTVIGGNNSQLSKSFEVDTVHKIKVERSTEEFASTPFDTQFRFEISYNKPDHELKASAFNPDSLVLDFYDSNVYYINVYLTSNYRWKSIKKVGTAMRMIFEVRPKTVAVPSIIDENEKDEDGNPAASINTALREKSITYDAKTSQSIAINFGDDYRAYKVDEALTTSFLKRDTTVTTLDKRVRYTAKSAGTYVVALTLADTNNYVWAEAPIINYTLKILPRAISVPDAFYIDSKDINDVHEDYEDIKNGVKGTAVVADALGEYKATETYTGKLHYMYLFGYAVENSEVDITVTSADTTNEDGLGHNDVSVSGITRGHYVFARLVNEYTISVEFKLNDEFGTPNCHWSGVAVGDDIQPRTFKLIIEKRGIDTPVLQPDPTQVFVNDKMEYHFTYDGLPTGPTLVIEQCLSTTPVKFMGYDYDQSKTKVSLDEATSTLKFSITGTAQVGTEYLLTVSLDDKNEYWNNPTTPTDTSDIADKLIYIIIDKLGIKKPTILNEGETDATYAADGLSKKFTYDTTAWPDAMRITNIDYSRIEYKTVDSSMYDPYKDGNNDLVIGTSKADSGTYSVILNLNDKTNLKWDGTTDDSSDITFSLVIDPVRIAKPVLDQAAMAGLFNSVDTNTIDDYNLSVIYHKGTDNLGIKQYIIVKNFVDDTNQMTYKFGNVEFEDKVGKINGNTCLKYGSATVGEYTLTISPKPNVGWDDGTDGDIVFTLKIEKKEYVTPDVDDPGLRLNPPVPTVVDQTRTVTYILKTDQTLLIKNVDNNVLELAERSDGLEFVGTSGLNDNEYTFKAQKVGTYTVKFMLKNPANEYLDCDSTKLKDSVTYTFIINKLDLDVPVFDTDSSLLLTDESITSNTFTAVYNAARHGALVLNVLGSDYMKYSPVRSDFDLDIVGAAHRGWFYYGKPVVTTELPPLPSGNYDTVKNIFNTSTFNGETFTTKVDGSFVDPASNVLMQLARENFILVHAAEPETYELVFTLTDDVNMQWADGSTSAKSIKLVIKKKEIPAPMPNGTVSKPYTGSPITFELKDVYGVKTAAGDPAFEYEIVIISKDGNVANDKMVAASLNTTTNVLTLKATEIGEYKVVIRIKDTNYTTWTSTSLTEKEFNFYITKSSISPQIKFVNPLLSDGVTSDALTLSDFLSSNFVWPKSTGVTAQITFPMLIKDTNGISMDSTLGLEIYYVDVTAPGKILKANGTDSITFTPYALITAVSPNFFATASLPAIGAKTTCTDSLGGVWTLDHDATDNYNLIYEFKLMPDKVEHKEDDMLKKIVIPKGNYALHVKQNGESKSYVVSDASLNFEVKPDRAPFEAQTIYDNLVWELYKLSDPKTVIKTYTRDDIFGVGTTTHWTAMTATNAVALNFLTDNDSYGFRINLDAVGLQGPNPLDTPATDVRAGLQRWMVDWDKTYIGAETAKYAGNYSVSVKIKALNPDLYSFADTTYTFYYKINKVLYDLNGLTWDYSGTPFTYDGTAKSVKITGVLPTGLSIASYDVTGYDRNTQVAVKYNSGDPTDPALNYCTSVVFKSNNSNYEVPDVNNPSSYLDTGGNFKWSVVWGIDKAAITANWTSKMVGDGTATMSIPKLDMHGEKVNYTYYRDNGDANPLNWDVVTTFEHTGFTDYLVVAELKSDPSNPETDFARNYTLTVNGSTPGLGVDNAFRFTLAPGNVVNVDLKIDGITQQGGAFATLPSCNIFKYDGTTTFSAVATISPAMPLLTDANLQVKYYSTTNKFKPLAGAPQTPGHYLVKVTLVDIPATDTTEYQLSDTEFYFDVEKGEFNPNDVYWHYAHTDADGNKIEAKFDPTVLPSGMWIVSSYTDKFGVSVPTMVGTAINKFVYDGNPHEVKLVSDDNNLAITTKNMTQQNAGEFTVANKNAAMASFSFNGKLWESPASFINSVFAWKIEKAVIQLSTLSWDYTTPFTYTISGGEEKKFSVKMDNVPTLIETFVEYKTYDLKDISDPKELSTNELTKAGKYKTVFSVKKFLDDEENAEMLKNYEFDNVILAEQTINWQIDVRQITIPVSNGSWTSFDGTGHDLMSSITILNEWDEYLTVSIKADFHDGKGLLSYSGVEDFGNEYFASHAGDYEFTFSIKEGINVKKSANTDEQINVEFAVASNKLDDQTATFSVSKAIMQVDSWIQNEEASSVVLSGTYVSNDFVDYKFEKAGGGPVTINYVASSSGETFDMTVFVRKEYENDITLVAAVGQSLTYTFTTLTVSNNMSDQIVVDKKPYIVGYVANGITHDFDYEEWQKMMLADPSFTVDKIDGSDEYDWEKYLGKNPAADDYVALDPDIPADKAKLAEIAEYKSKVRVDVTYGGFPITFRIYRWDYYQTYLNLWQGGLTQSAAGDYFVSYTFIKNSLNPLCWSVEDTDSDGVYDAVDRAPVTLNYRVSFKKIPLPEFKNPTFTGSEINILGYCFGDEEFSKWLDEYKDYFDIEGATATDAGAYTLKMAIKTEFLSTVHWGTDSANGQPGTYTYKWKILPIYIEIPKFSGATITYDGSSHSVFELFEGYNNGALNDELKALMQLTIISGDNAVNAGTYNVRFKLPDSNYAWKSAEGSVAELNDLQPFSWKIEKKQLDMSKIGWGDGDKPYDESKPFQYTIEDGEVQSHKIEFTGIPDELKEFMTYITDGEIGNERSDMGTYRTVVYFFQNDIAYSNYELVNPPQDFLDKYKDPAGNGYASIEWKITERKFDIPEDTKVDFDGTVREIPQLFGFEEGWENYLDLKIEYKPLGAGDDEYVTYSDIAESDDLLDNSMYNAYYLGSYRVVFSIKDGLNSDSDCVVWVSGGIGLTTTQTAVLTIKPLELTIDGWTTDSNPDSTPDSEWKSNKGNYKINSTDFDALSEDSKKVFDYIIRDKATGDKVTMDDVASRGAGIIYTVEFAVKDADSYAAKEGIQIICASGVDNPHEFTNMEFTSNTATPQDSVVYWLPIPQLVPVANNTYDGKDKVYQIANYSDYLMSAAFKTYMDTTYGIDLSGVDSFLVAAGKYASCVNVSTGEITIKTAGDFEILLRLLPGVNLSWLPAGYSYDFTLNQVKDTTPAVITGAALDAIVDRNAKKLDITVEKASVPFITPEMLEMLEGMIPTFNYTGNEYDLTKLDETKSLFNQLASYGDLISFDGYKGTEAGEYKLIIKLTDPNSSYWNLKETETVVVNDKSFDGYDADYQVKYVYESGKWVIKYVKADGTDYNGGDYTLEVVYKMSKVIDEYVDATGLVDENGMPETASGAKYVVDESGKAVKYALVDGEYVEDAAGTYLAKYKLRADGSIMEMPDVEDGKNVIDTDKTLVKVTRVKTSIDPYEIKWTITTQALAVPTVNENVKLTFNGSEQFAEKVLSGFNGTFMEIVEGGSGVNAGDYTAKIKIKDDNYKWAEGADEDGFVYVTWTIGKATADLSNVSWRFTDGTKDYENGEGMVFTIKDGKAVVYWAELANLPEALKGCIKYETNGVSGAYAGRNAGKYVTSFKIVDPDSNFSEIIIPETLAGTVTWNIQRRMLEIPSVNVTQMIFDDEPHDLLAMLNIQSDWAEYYTITVMYAKNYTAFDVYTGHDGNPYEAYGAGAYRFIFTIKSGINTNKNNPCVVWLKSSGEVITPDVPEEEVKEETEQPVEAPKLKRAPVETEVIEQAETVEEVVSVTDAVEPQQAESHAVSSVVREVCDRIKRLTYGAQISLRRYF